MLWERKDQCDDIISLMKKADPNRSVSIVIEGQKGMGKSDLIDAVVQKLPEPIVPVNRLDLKYETIPAERLPLYILMGYREKQPAPLHEFMAALTPETREYLKKQLDELPNISPDKISWYSELFIQFLEYLSRKNRPLFIFENMDEVNNATWQALHQFLRQMDQFCPILLFSRDPAGVFHPDIPVDHLLFLDKLSIQEVERSISQYLDTDRMNARLIANHCYLKTNGNPLKIRLLIEGKYRRLIEAAGGGFINVQQLQESQVFSDWNAQFELLFHSLSHDQQNIMAFLAHFESAVRRDDLLTFLGAMGKSAAETRRWKESGLLREFQSFGEPMVSLNPPEWKTYLRERIPLEEVRPLVDAFYRLQKEGRLKAVYKISPMFYELGAMEQAVASAEREGTYFFARGQLAAAAERLFFLVRISHLYPELVQNVGDILLLAGEVYLRMGANENAFEILRQLRDLYTPDSRNATPEELNHWLQTNLKMVRALISMDAFQEARYLIREMRVKEFCGPDVHAMCDELQGDIELNLNRPAYALQNYRESLRRFRAFGRAADVYRLYIKIKPLLTGPDSQPGALLDELIEYFGKAPRGGDDYLAHLLRDRIQLFLSDGDLREALHHSHRLWRELRHVYHPQLRVQVALYLADLYARFGKWRYAIGHLERLIRTVPLRYRPQLYVQVLIQLGMIYKEQAQYGRARKILETAQEQARQHRLAAEQNEITLHLGHLYLLVHALLYAAENLSEAQRLAERLNQNDVALLARLYLSDYELQSRRLDRAQGWLREAKKLVNSSQHPVDFLNYLYYYSLWLLAAARPDDAATVVALLTEKARNYARYRAVAAYLQAKIAVQKGDSVAAESALSAAEKMARECGYPQISYLVACEWARLTRNTGHFPDRLRNACDMIGEIAEKIGDEILKHQFLEARQHEDIIGWCKQEEQL